MRDLQQTADDNDAADGIGDAHQRSVQCRGHVPDDLPADNAGHHKDREMLEELSGSSAEEEKQHERCEEAATNARGRRGRGRCGVAVSVPL